MRATTRKAKPAVKVPREVYKWSFDVAANMPRAWLSTAETLLDSAQAVKKAAEAKGGETAYQQGLMLADYAPYDPSFTGGIYVASGKTSNNRDASNFIYADIITSAGLGGGPHVKVYRLLDALYNAQGQPENWRFFEAASFYAYAPTFYGGVRVGVVNHGTSGLDDIITSAGVNGGPHVRLLNQTSVTDLVTFAPSQRMEFYAFDPTFLGGTFVG